MNCCQAVHLCCVIFWVPMRNRLEAEPCAVRRHKLPNPVFWVLMNCPTVMNNRQATRVEFIRFGCFLCVGRFLIREKLCSNLYEWLDIVFQWKFVEFGFNWDENRMKVILGLMNWGFQKRHQSKWKMWMNLGMGSVRDEL